MATQILRRFYARQEALDDRAALTRRLLESGEMAPELARKVLSLIGDEKQLRGVPVIGRGVAGAIAGTNPSRFSTRD